MAAVETVEVALVPEPGHDAFLEAGTDLLVEHQTRGVEAIPGQMASCSGAEDLQGRDCFRKRNLEEDQSVPSAFEQVGTNPWACRFRVVESGSLEAPASTRTSYQGHGKAATEADRNLEDQMVPVGAGSVLRTVRH